VYIYVDALFIVRSITYKLCAAGKFFVFFPCFSEYVIYLDRRNGTSVTIFFSKIGKDGIIGTSVADGNQNK